jgi:hypothetical protein
VWNSYGAAPVLTKRQGRAENKKWGKEGRKKKRKKLKEKEKKP